MKVNNNTTRQIYDWEKDSTYGTGSRKASGGTLVLASNPCGEDIDVPDFMNHRSKNARVRTNKYGDSVEIHTKNTGKNNGTNKSQAAQQNRETLQRTRVREQKAQQRKTQAIKERAIAAAIAFTLLAGGGVAVPAAHDYITRFDTASANYDALGHTVSEVASWSGINEKAILLANDISSADEVVDDIVLPVEYDVFHEEIESIKSKLDNPDLSDEKRDELTERLALLCDKQEAAYELGETYIDEDGKFVYIIPNEYTSTETIKEIYGIKDGVLKEYNNLSYQWGINTEVDVHQGYKDYTGSKTSGVRVPADKIGNYED